MDWFKFSLRLLWIFIKLAAMSVIFALAAIICVVATYGAALFVVIPAAVIFLIWVIIWWLVPQIKAAVAESKGP